ALEKLDVTPEIGYILLLESGYLKGPSYPALERNPRGTALGPWQIIDDTAEYIRDISSIEFIITGDKNDDRTFGMNSTIMGGIYARSLLQKHEAGLAIAGYHGGQGTAANA